MRMHTRSNEQREKEGRGGSGSDVQGNDREGGVGGD